MYRKGFISYRFPLFCILIVVLACQLLTSGRGMATLATGGNVGDQAFPEPADEQVLPFVYAFVRTDNVPVYKSPGDAAEGLPPVRYTKAGSIWVSLVDPHPEIYDQEIWYCINPNEYVLGEYLRFAEPSQFQGVRVPHYFDKNFAWLLFNTRLSPEPGVSAPYDAPILPSRTLVIVEELRKVGDRQWARLRGDQWVEYTKIGMVSPSPRPAEVKETERWLEVNLFEQTLAAYEGDQLVYATLISSGRSDYPTEQGLFRIWVKAKLAKMSGGEEGLDYYYLEDVPWHMYFYRSFALHGSYWHDYYGLPNSHGCVNLSPKDAKWLFDWVSPQNGSANWKRASKNEPGTWVWVHE